MFLCVDDTSILTANSNKLDFYGNTKKKKTSQEVNAWFKNNMLTLNFNKTWFLEFRTNHFYHAATQIDYDLNGITNANEARYLGLILDNNLSWKQHIKQVVSKMCSTCYVIQNIKTLVSQDTLDRKSVV
jgi:arsenate reductase-like glutaredoxin family protein